MALTESKGKRWGLAELVPPTCLGGPSYTRPKLLEDEEWGLHGTSETGDFKDSRSSALRVHTGGPNRRAELNEALFEMRAGDWGLEILGTRGTRPSEESSLRNLLEQLRRSGGEGAAKCR